MEPLSDLKVTITRVDEPNVVVDDYVISKEEFILGVEAWKEDLIRVVKSAIQWELAGKKPYESY